MAEYSLMTSESFNFEFLTSLSEIADFVDRSPRTVERWLDAGLPAARLDRNRVVTTTAIVREWLASERGDERDPAHGQK